MSATVRTLISSYATLQERYRIDEALDARLDIEMAVKKLSEDRILTDMERQVLAVASSGCSNNRGASGLGLRRKTYIKLFRSAAKKISDYLGEDYGDDWIFHEVEMRLGRRLRGYEIRKIKNFLFHYNGAYNPKGILRR